MALSDKLPVLDNRSFNDLVSEARARIPRYTREWTDFNDSDPGFTLVQLFAWLGEMLLFRLNQVPELNHIKFLELIGLRLEPARPSQVWLSFQPESDPATPPWLELPRRTQVASAEADDAGPIVFETDRRLIVLKAALDAVRIFSGGTWQDVTAGNATAEEPWHPLAEAADPGNALALALATEDAEIPAGIELALAFFAAGGGQGGGAVTCGGGGSTCRNCLAWEYHDGRDWRALPLLGDETDALSRTGQVLLKTPPRKLWQKLRLGGASDAPRFWLRARVLRNGWAQVPRALAIRTNMVAATQGETVEGEILGGSDGTADQAFALSGRPVQVGTLLLEVDDGDGRGFVPWHEVDDLAAAGRDEPAYALDRGAGMVRFAGVRGRIPVANPDRPASSIRARSYRFGGGRRGNLPAGAITSLLTPVPGIDTARVTNPFPAAGGTEEEELEAAKLRAARMLKARDRAVTAEDFEALAISAGPIGRVKALPLFHPDFPGVEVPGVVTVVVVPDEKGPAPVPSEGLLRAVCRCLDSRRLLTTEVHVTPPTYLPVRVTAEVVAPPGADAAELREAAVAALDAYLHPLTGGAKGRGWPFGGDVFFSALHQRLLAAGAARVVSAIIELDGEEYPNCTDVPVPAGALLASAGHEVIVQEELAG
ncbi:putative baseplate assembly protein [Paracraurococcus lichenis]|uniref:Baseplate assembly protein n=1 Tax=Paracraurococcus lichenis TaxID=3064888 RepID=A0ABT9E9L7_9PROT|nr:putative baseplate assembly protein [Paracraurococcus sp. LOR1-02]MDO9712897.1 putative baseplate assembly protein [Paracraurococcus sp. LOR1-02]